MTLFIIACDSSAPSSRSEPISGATLFRKHCTSCHGINGALQLNGAKNLNESTLSYEERITLITNGKNLMTPFKNVLSRNEIEAVAEYSLTFSKSSE